MQASTNSADGIVGNTVRSAVARDSPAASAASADRDTAGGGDTDADEAENENVDATGSAGADEEAGHCLCLTAAGPPSLGVAVAGVEMFMEDEACSRSAPPARGLIKSMVENRRLLTRTDAKVRHSDRNSWRVRQKRQTNEGQRKKKGECQEENKKKVSTPRNTCTINK